MARFCKTPPRTLVSPDHDLWLLIKWKRLPLQKRVPRVECEAPSLNSLASDLCHLTEPNAATVLDSLARRYQQNVIH
ncbi:hypothetical protein TELCIR_22534, partial [Teladorsagia circumcincta]